MYQFPTIFSFPNLTHFISTRQGGVSKEQFTSLNVSQLVGDVAEKVYENRRTLAESLGTSSETCILPQLTHGKNVQIVGKMDAGRGWAQHETAILDTDALITQEKGLCLIVTLADCTPLLFFDPKKEVIAVAHAGWKGTFAKIGVETLQKMHTHFGCEMQDILVGIGISIGQCCYEISEDLAHKFCENFGEEVVLYKEGKPHLDLWQANQIQLLEAGILPQNIAIAGVCTACNSDVFFSHRKEAGKTGRFCAGMMML